MYNWSDVGCGKGTHWLEELALVEVGQGVHRTLHRRWNVDPGGEDMGKFSSSWFCFLK